ncbi:hypothetical protein H920_10384 [Fukomys damarensis]|uniref:Uncharacterized protein n=1 Tax=Fukomys damarensis TaxID=885580 RepID=A0A091DB12_FUKDA|nr:hypothetical protein H920_10384 [Fukomys damarensis]
MAAADTKTAIQGQAAALEVAALAISQHLPATWKVEKLDNCGLESQFYCYILGSVKESTQCFGEFCLAPKRVKLQIQPGLTGHSQILEQDAIPCLKTISGYPAQLRVAQPNGMVGLVHWDG